MTPLSIAPLVAGQVSGLAALAQQSWLAAFTEGLTESDIRAALAQRDQSYFEAVIDVHHIWLAVVANDIAGFIECQLQDEEVLIDKLYVAERFQGQGIGKALLAHALNAKVLMNKAAELDVWVDNPRAIALYQSFGFKKIGERPFVSSSGEALSPDWIMRRDCI